MSTIKAVTAETFEKEVLKVKEVVLVDFWAVWCGPCQMINPIINEIATEHAGAVKVVKLNTDEHPDIASKYGIMSIPTLLLFKNGAPVEKIVGAVPKRIIKDVIEKVLKEHPHA